MELFIGIIIGITLGLTGAGGSVFAVPALIYLAELPVQQAIGLSLGAVFASAIFGVLIRFKSGNIQWLVAAVYAVLGAISAPFGRILSTMINDQVLLIGFSILVTYIALHLWRQASETPESAKTVRASTEAIAGKTAICTNNDNQPFRPGLRCILGVASGALLTGLLSGLIGVGGGFIIVPTLLMLTGLSIAQAVSTSLAIISVISLSGFTTFLLGDTFIDNYLLASISVGGILGMTAGILLSKYVAGPNLQKIFALLMLLIAAFTLSKFI